MKAKKGRPTFKIDPVRLKGIRNDKGLTQEEVAFKAAELLGKANNDDRSKLTRYQKIEKEGNTSRKMAEALGKVLEVELRVLTGEESPDPRSYLNKMIALIRTLAEETNSPELKRRLDESDSDQIISIAEDVGEMIETVQLGRNPTAISELVEYLGLPESEILAPAYSQGHWLIMSNLSETKILSGINAVYGEIEKMTQEKQIPFLDHDSFSPAIRMWRDGFWFRVEVEPGSGAPKTRIDFVRCEPNAKGLNWARAYWQDELSISSRLKAWSYSVANSVKDFNGVESPKNLDGLRLVVSQRMITSNIHQDCSSLMQAVVSAPKLSHEIQERLEQEGVIRITCQDRLSKELSSVMMPCLAKYSDEMWDISIESGVVIKLKNSTNRSAEFPEGLRYEISLVEEISPNKFVHVPWRVQDRNRLKEKIQDWLKDIGSYADSESTHRQFEMIENIVRVGPSLRLTPYL